MKFATEMDGKFIIHSMEAHEKNTISFFISLFVYIYFRNNQNWFFVRLHIGKKKIN